MAALKSAFSDFFFFFLHNWLPNINTVRLGKAKASGRMTVCSPSDRINRFKFFLNPYNYLKKNIISK